MRRDQKGRISSNFSDSKTPLSGNSGTACCVSAPLDRAENGHTEGEGFYMFPAPLHVVLVAAAEREDRLTCLLCSEKTHAHTMRGARGE